MLINLSNHPSVDWGNAQKSASINLFGNVQDMGFPPINPEWSTEKVAEIALKFAKEIKAQDVKNVMVQGEMAFVSNFVFFAQSMGIECWQSTTNRAENFKFVQFRKYFNLFSQVEKVTKQMEYDAGWGVATPDYSFLTKFEKLPVNR